MRCTQRSNCNGPCDGADGMRALWVHNFDPGIPSSGVFMHKLAWAVQSQGVAVDMLYTGLLSSPLEAWRAWRQLERLEREFDVVHTQYGSMCGWLGARVTQPKVLSVRGSDWCRVDQGDWRERTHARLANALTRASVPRYDHVISMSYRMKAEIDRFLEHRVATSPTVSVVTDGISLSQFKPMDRQLARHALGLGGDARPWVLLTTLAESNPIKRVDLAKRAVAFAQESLPGLQLKVASGIEHAKMHLWINACDVTLMCSMHEGWPNAIKESLACGVPFVATDISDLRRISDVDSSCIVTDATADALADGLLRCLAQPRDSDRLRSHVHAFELLAVANKLIDVYSGLKGR